MRSGLESAEKVLVTPLALNKAWEDRPVVKARKSRELVPEQERVKGKRDGIALLLHMKFCNKSQKH